MVSPSNSNAPHLVPAGCIAPADGVGKGATGTIADGVQPSKSQQYMFVCVSPFISRKSLPVPSVVSRTAADEEIVLSVQ
jgi:hypothetical protein